MRRQNLAEKNTEEFVAHLYEMIHVRNNKGFAAKLKKGESESTDVYAWEVLAHWVDLQNEQRTKAYSLIGAAVARSPQSKDGCNGLGKGLWMSVEDKQDIETSFAATRLRRLLACQDSNELIRILRSTLRFLQSKDIVLDYSRLLDELLGFNWDNSRDITRTRWAMEFFGQKENK